MASLKYLIYILYQFNLIFLSFSSKNVGDSCNLKSGVQGICKDFPLCPTVQREFKQGLMPVTCGFIGRVPIVCCPEETESSSESPPVKENIAKPPGETATFWCENYQKICNTNGLPYIDPLIDPLLPLETIGLRSRRDLNSTEILDYDDFGTTEKAIIETTTDIPIKNDEGAIVGGVNAEMDEFPHMAAIGYGRENEVKWLCGGSLISEKFVLTAAHCLHSRSDGPAQWVHLGSERIQDELRATSLTASNGQTHRVLRRVRHPGYRPPSKYHDVALIEIGPALEAQPLSTMSKTIHPACLQVSYEFGVEKAVATGWGRTGHFDDVTASLQKVELDILDKSICNKTYEYEIKWSNALKQGMDESVVCSGVMSGGKDTCIGDSGGPLQIRMSSNTCNYKILAITSFGKVCGFSNSPAVYMNVPYYIPWIESIVWPES